MKKTLSVILCIMAIIALSSCYNYYIPWPLPGMDDQTPADEPYAPAENADKKLSGAITVDQVTAAFNEEGVDSVAFEGTITVGDAETLNIPAGKSLIGVDPEKSLIQGNYKTGSAGTLVTVAGTLDNVTARLNPDESFANWNDGTTRNQIINMAGGTLRNSVITNGRNGVQLHSNSCSGSIIENNQIYHNRTGINVQLHPALTSEVTIRNNNIYENETMGIVFMSMTGATGDLGTINVVGNTISDNWYSNIEVRKHPDVTYTVNISGNDFEDGTPESKEFVNLNSGSKEHSSDKRYDDYFNGGLTEDPNPTFVANIVYTTLPVSP